MTVTEKYRRLTIILIISLILAGCGEASEEIDSIPTLDNSQWPTPTAVVVASTATPFPIITLEATSPADATTSIIDEGAAPGQESEAQLETLLEEAIGTAETTGLAEQIQQRLGAADLPVVAGAEVESAAVDIRQGPGADYERLGSLSRGDAVSVLALDGDRTWALVKTNDDALGWVPVADLTPDESLAEAPTILSAAPGEALTPGQIATISNLIAGDDATLAADAPQRETNDVQPAGNSVSPALVEGGSSSLAAGGEPAAGVDALRSVAAARTSRPEAPVRPAPTTDAAAIAELTDDQENLSILALDRSGDWALIEPSRAESRMGWVALEDLNIESSLDDAPRIMTAWVKSNGVSVRQGPALFHPYVGTLSINTLVVLLGRNENKTWAAIQPVGGDGYGWVRLADLDGYGSIAGLPLAPEPAPGPAGDPAGVSLSGELREIEPGIIVFQRSSGGEIMAINADGTGLRFLTHGIDPVLSPNGQTVAFTRWEQGEAGPGALWTINIDGGDERMALGEINKQPKGAAWSPDGTRIVLNYQSGGRLESRRQCGDLSNNPSPPSNATDVEAGVDVKGPGEVDVDLCWTIPPDPHWGLRVVDVAGGAFDDLDGGTYAFRPTWDPNQPWRIVSDGGRGLVDIDLVQDRRIALTENLQDGSPVFSPDGRFIALTARQQSGGKAGHDIHRLNANGGARARLTQTPFWQTAQPDGRAWNNVAPAWSPDSFHIAFLTDRAGRWEIWVMNAGGSNQRPLFTDEVNDDLQIAYDFVDERVMSWR